MTVRAATAAATGTAFLLLSGCASTQNVPSVTSQVDSVIQRAYQATVGIPGVAGTLEISIVDGVDTISRASGAVEFMFRKHTALTQLSVPGQGTLRVIRAGDEFFGLGKSARPGSNAKWEKLDLIPYALHNPAFLPQIETPGLDPFQLLTILQAVTWQSSILSELPVAVNDSGRNYTEYQITVDAKKLAQHLPEVDRAWLAIMATQPGGSDISLMIRLAGGRIASLTCDLPLPSASNNAGSPALSSAPTTPPAEMANVSLNFDYGKMAAPIIFPSIYETVQAPPP